MVGPITCCNINKDIVRERLQRYSASRLCIQARSEFLPALDDFQAAKHKVLQPPNTKYSDFLSGSNSFLPARIKAGKAKYLSCSWSRKTHNKAYSTYDRLAVIWTQCWVIRKHKWAEMSWSSNKAYSTLPREQDIYAKNSLTENTQAKSQHIYPQYNMKWNADRY